MEKYKMSLSEKFRPTDWSSVVGQKHIVNILQHKTDLDHMLFVGPPGVGKTTVARLLAKQHDLPLVETNASVDRGIGMVRDIVKKHSESGTKKIILLDEADQISTDGMHALRGII
jgi:replication-associated recombination protein RarA